MYQLRAVSEIQNVLSEGWEAEKKIEMVIAILKNFNYVGIKNPFKMRDYRDQDINFITEFGDPNQILDTSYGWLTRLDWQKEEVKRIGNCSIFKNEMGLTAIIKGRYGKISR